MLRLAAQMQEWDKDKFIAAAQQDYRLGAEKVAEFHKHIYLDQVAVMHVVNVFASADHREAVIEGPLVC